MTIVLGLYDCFFRAFSSSPDCNRSVFRTSLNLIIIKVFIKREILSVEINLSTYTHTHTHARTHARTCTHEYTDYTKVTLHSLKRAAISDLRWMKTAARNRKHGRSTVLGKEKFLGYT